MSILDLAQPAEKTVGSVNAVIYGDSGVGKTHFAGSGADGGERNLIVAVENGTVSAARAGSKTNVIKVESWDQLLEIVEAIIDEPDRFDWVVIDSITKVQDLAWDEIIDKATSKSPSRSPYKRELQEYGESQLMVKRIVKDLNDSDANIIYTALGQLGTDQEGNEFQLPALHGKKGELAKWLCAEVDIIGYMDIGVKKEREFRRLRFNKSPEVFAKDRFGAFPNPVGNLTLEKFTERLLANSVTEDSTTEATEASDNTNTTPEENQ